MKFLDLNRIYDNFDWKQVLTPIFENTSFINGSEIEKFEEQVTKYIDCEYAVGVSSGTDALQVALLALGATKDTVVLTTPYTFIATSEVPVRLGMKVVFCDIDESFNIDIEKAKEIISGKNIDVFIPVHLFGKPCKLDQELLYLCAEKGTKIVEDAAQAFGSWAKFKDQGLRMVGTFGDIGCFSFFPAKNIGCAGDAGMIVTNNEKYYQIAKAMRNHGSMIKYQNDYHGGNFRMDTIQAALLNYHLKNINKYLDDRLKTALYYLDELEKLPIVLPKHEGLGHTYNQFVIQTRNEQERDALKEFLNIKNIPIVIYYPMSSDEQKCYNGYDFECNCLMSKKMARVNLALPIALLTREEREYIVKNIKLFYEGR